MLLFAYFLSVIGVFAIAQTNSNFTVGSVLSTTDKNITSPSGDFVFGFRRLSGEKEQYLLAIWFAQIPDQTIVWSANRNQPVERESKVELTANGQLVLKAPSGWEWNSGRVNDNGVSHGAIRDTGNFVILSKNSEIIWQSFEHPTDTILPSQVLHFGSSLSSALTARSYKEGKFQLLINDSGLTLNQIDVFTRIPVGAYGNISQSKLDPQDAPQLTLTQSGYIQLKHRNGSVKDLAPQLRGPGENFYYRATITFDGVFTLYSCPKNSDVSQSWSAEWFEPQNICKDITKGGVGACGFNSICEVHQDGRPSCQCPPGFSFLDSSNPNSGCKQDNEGYQQECDGEGSVINKDHFGLSETQFADWPFSDYQFLEPANETECKTSCLGDCNCVVAVFQAPSFNRGIGRCWKKKMPLSYGRLDRSEIDRKAIFKIFKLNSPSNPIECREEQKPIIVILGALLGTSAVFNIFSIAAISLVIFFLCKRNLKYTPNTRNLETNLHSFTYKELEQATQGFKEELGRVLLALFTKGVLASGYKRNIAVKKLDKVMQEGEKEFENEVNVIGQTHHKNLVRLLGYCNEQEQRLLVYEFLHNGSLSNFLFGGLRPTWSQRMQIASGIARGLMYLHEECSTQIIHCDIKPQNILLDDSFTAKISDFGLAKRMMINQSHTLTGIRGTRGYVAPEWFRNTPVTVKVDVYSFGVMLLEIISCRRCVELEMEKAAILTDWAYECQSKGEVEKLVENDEEARSDRRTLEKSVMIAIWCVQEEQSLRPNMRMVALMLEDILEVPPPPCPFPGSML